MGRICNCVFLCLSLYLINFQSTMAGKITNVNFSKGVQSFANDIYATVSEEKPNDNVIMSPLSINLALALCGMGASGETATEMSKGLKLSPAALTDTEANFAELMDTFDKEPTVKIANKIYVMQGFSVKPKYNEIAQKSFKSEVQNVDFAKNVESAKTINTWVEDKTNKKIKDLISSDALDGLTRLVLVNAIYFKGMWAKKFDAQLTTKQPFYVSNTDSKQVDMMKIKDKFMYGEFDNLKAKAIELPYANSSISMFIILPNEKEGLKDLQKEIRNIDIGNMRSSMRNVEVDVKIPKFKVEFSIELKEPLKKLGFNKMFSSGADFSEMLTKPEDLSVSSVIHKAFIEVNEEGTEAAAATAILLVRKAMAYPIDPPKQFIADHPFIYAIVSRTENAEPTVTFFGNVNNI